MLYATSSPFETLAHVPLHRSNPSEKYCMFESVPLVNRTWPTKKPTSPPIWLSTDLRDGNQALINPMTNSTKLRLFK
jgi:2-isopropylmalate synthase